MTLATLDAPAAAEDAPPPTFDEALRWFRARVPMTQAAFDALAADAAGRAFTLAGVARLTVVSEVWRALDAALASGTTLRDFKREVAPSLLEQWGGSVANPAWRMELVFRNATQRAYVHGRVEQLRDPEVARIRPVWMFDAVGDARTSAICSALDGTVLAASDPWWSTHTPPCHHACRSTVRGLRASDPRAKAATSAPPMVAAQQGFGATPEAEGWRPRAADYPPEVWAAYQSGPSAYRPRTPTVEMPVFAPPVPAKPRAPTREMPAFTPPPPERARIEFKAPKPKKAAALPNDKAAKFEALPVNRLVDKKLLGDHDRKLYPQNALGDRAFDAKAADAIFNAGLTREQVAALKRYTGPAYGPVNLYLRAGPDAVRKRFGPKAMDGVEELIRDTTAAVRAIPAPPANMVLFRGAQFKDFAELDALAAADTITAPTFLSTSRDPKVAVGFSGGMFNTEPSVVYRIRKHRSGAALGAPYSLEAEAEVLFPPGTRFRVTGRQRVSESQLLVDLEEIE